MSCVPVAAVTHCSKSRYLLRVSSEGMDFRYTALEEYYKYPTRERLLLRMSRIDVKKKSSKRRLQL
jgi:hypothetical protein